MRVLRPKELYPSKPVAGHHAGQPQQRMAVNAAANRALANTPLPLPILCPADGVEPVDGVLPHLCGGRCDARQSCLNLLPCVGPGWYPKVAGVKAQRVGSYHMGVLQIGNNPNTEQPAEHEGVAGAAPYRGRKVPKRVFVAVAEVEDGGWTTACG